MKKLLVALSIYSVLSCSMDEQNRVSIIEVSSPCLLTKSSTDDELHTNPYSLRNMQAASDSLNSSLGIPLQKLNPTDLYLCFSPQDSLDIISLNNLNYELFSYPLDDSYPEVQVSEDSIQRVYCVLPFDAIIPNIAFSVIDTCYIPEYVSDEIQLSRMSREEHNYNEQLEILAYKLSGNPVQAFGQNPQLMSTNGGFGPSGTIAIVDRQSDSTTRLTSPLKRIKIVAHSFVRVIATYTDDNGYFEIPQNFVTRPKIRIKTETQNDGKVYSGILGLLASEYILPGRYEYSADFTFESDNSFWKTALVYKYYTDYLEFCSLYNIQRPNPDLRIKVSNTTRYNGGAPMLQHLDPHNYPNDTKRWIDQFVQHLLNIFSSSCPLSIFSSLCPDIIIATSRDASDIEHAVFHELIHASHFASGGSEYWPFIITEITANSLAGQSVYGDGLSCTTNQNFLEIAESLAYGATDFFFSNEGLAERENKWFTCSANTIYGLLNSHVVALSDLMSALGDTSKNIDEMYSLLCENLPYRSLEITKIFHDNSSLLSETCWVIENLCSDTIDISLRRGQFSWGQVLAPGEETYFTSCQGNVAFNNLITDHPFLYPNAIEFSVNGNVFFSQLNGSPIIRMNRPFFNSMEWNWIGEQYELRGRRVKKYIFTLTDYDFLNI